jgi:hypothetical protein
VFKTAFLPLAFLLLVVVAIADQPAIWCFGGTFSFAFTFACLVLAIPFSLGPFAWPKVVLVASSWSLVVVVVGEPTS